MDKQFNYRYRVSPDLASDFAKHNCKKCQGRGLLVYDDIDSVEIRYEYCNCVKNRMKQYRKN